MNRLFREEGKSRFAVFLWLFLLFVVVHIGLQLIPMYMDSWRMEDEIKSKIATAQVARPTDDELRFALSKYARDLGLPPAAENIVVVRNEEPRTLKIGNAWDVEIKFFWGICGESCIRRYHFEPSAEGNY